MLYINLALCFSLLASAAPSADLGYVPLPLKQNDKSATTTLSRSKTSFTASATLCPAIKPFGGSKAGKSYYNGLPMNSTGHGCRVKNRLNANGSCAGHMATPLAGSCAAYCEVRNYFFYGHAVRFNETKVYQPGQNASIGAGKEVEVKQVFNLPGRADAFFNTTKIKNADEKGEMNAVIAAFKKGSTFPYASKALKVTSTQHVRPLGTEKQCGYFAAVPVFVTSCGSLTTAPANTAYNVYTNPVHRRTRGKVQGQDKENMLCDNTRLRTTSNFCGTAPYPDADVKGGQASQTVWVTVDCKTGKPLKTGQDPVFEMSL